MLKWDNTEIVPLTAVNLLDMTLSIENGTIVSKTHQKEMNLYLYIPLASELPPAALKERYSVSSSDVSSKTLLKKTLLTLLAFFIFALSKEAGTKTTVISWV